MSESINRYKAELIVSAIEDSISYRCGFHTGLYNEWIMIDDDEIIEIRQKWADMIQKILES